MAVWKVQEKKKKANVWKVGETAPSTQKVVAQAKAPSKKDLERIKQRYLDPKNFKPVKAPIMSTLEDMTKGVADSYFDPSNAKNTGKETVGGTIMGGLNQISKSTADFGEAATDFALNAGTSKFNPYYWFNPDKLKSHQAIAQELIKEDQSEMFFDKLGYNRVQENGKTVQQNLDDKSLIKSNNFAGKITRGVGGQLIPAMFGKMGGTNAMKIAGSSIPLATKVYGSTLDEAYNAGATRSQANTAAVAKTAVEFVTEWTTNGMPGVKMKRIGGLDKIVFKATDKIANELTRSLVNAGYSLVGEGAEEALAEIMDPIINNATYSKGETIDWNQVMQSAIEGAIVAGIMNAPSNITEIKTAATNTKTKEEAMKVLENIEIELKNGNITQEDKQALEIMKANITTAVSGKQDLVPNVDIVDKTPLKSQPNMPTLSEIKPIATQTTQEQVNVPTDTIKTNLGLKTNTIDNMAQYFDINKVETQSLAQTLDKISSDRQLEVKFDINIKSDGIYVNTNGIRQVVLNPNSNRVVEFTLMHELAHDMEGQNAYEELKQTILSYDKGKTGFESARANLESIYNDYYKANNIDAKELNIDNEATNDILGQMLGDQNFVNQLSIKKPNVFNRVLKWVNNQIELLKSSNKEQTRFLQDIKSKFEKAYRENATSKEGTQYSIRQDKNGKSYVEIDTDQNIFDGKSLKEQLKIARDYILNKFRKSGLWIGEENIDVSRNGAKKYIASSLELDKRSKNAKIKASTELDNLLSVSEYKNSLPDDGRHRFAKDGWDYYETTFKVGNNVFTGLINVGKDGNIKTFYDLTNIKKTTLSYDVDKKSTAGLNYRLPFSKSNVSQNKENVNLNPTLNDDIKYSQSQEGKWQERLDTTYNVEGKKTTKTSDIRLAPVKVESKQTIETKPDVSKQETQANIQTHDDAVKEYGAFKQGGQPRARDVEIAKETDAGKTSRFYRTVAESKIADEQMVENIKSLIGEGKGTYVPLSDKKALDSANSTLESSGFDSSVAYINTKFNSNERITKNDLVLAERLIQEAQAKGDYKTATDMIVKTALMGSELGQSVQALSMIKKLSPEGRLMTLENIVNRENKTNTTLQKKNKKIEIPQESKEAILKAQTPAEVDIAVSKALENVAKQMPITLADQFRSWRYLAMLGNPKTHIRNLVANAAMLGETKVKNAVAATIEDIINPTERTKTLQRTSKEVKDFVKKDAIANAERIQGQDKYDLKSQLNIKQPAFTNKTIMGKVANFAAETNSKALNWEDFLFSTPAYRSALGNYITANKMDVNNIDQVKLEKGRQYAIDQAQEQVFRQASNVANSLNRLEKTNSVTKIAVGAILPFKKTPINIAKTGVQYSPIGLIKGVGNMVIDLKSGKPTSASIDTVAKGLTGTGTMLLGVWLRSLGLLRGSGSDEPKEEYFEQSQGRQAYSIEIGNTSYTLDWLSPAAMSLFAGVEVYDLATSKDNLDTTKLTATVDGLSKLLDPLTEMSMLQGLNSTLQSYNANDSVGGYIGAVGVNALQNYAGQFVPTVLGQVARTIDGTRRSTTAKGKGIDKIVGTFANKQIAKIPFASKTLEPYTNQFGKEEKTKDAAKRAIQNFISPGYIKELKSSKIEKELQRLFNNTGDAKVLPSSSARYFTVDGKKIYLTPSEYTAFNKKDGATALEYLGNLINSEYYKDLSDEKKAEHILGLYREAQKVAKEDYFNKK